MAALAQPDLQETAIRKVLGSIPLPDGTRFQRLEFRNDSTGDPALFLVYSIRESLQPDEKVAFELQALRAAIRHRLRDLGLSLFPHTTFIAE